ncbi:hypothetical protein [Enterococcus termitis]|uniref:Uncharacterized protein n=1 Tax=Enterococcus termitis TaxID=332950 RepID=A0A1E5H191_9ENTE|nr:hypothetical protein [Enterococcus termitis]OEG18663.1 hypothetical protein BCR25_15795 [Enterococcus termitis]
MKRKELILEKGQANSLEELYQLINKYEKLKENPITDQNYKMDFTAKNVSIDFLDKEFQKGEIVVEHLNNSIGITKITKLEQHRGDTLVYTGRLLDNSPESSETRFYWLYKIEALCVDYKIYIGEY